MIEKGAVKLINFSRHNNKFHYIYHLTPKGIEEKSRLTSTFLKVKIKEYEELKKEINSLKQDVEKLNSLHK